MAPVLDAWEAADPVDDTEVPAVMDTVDEFSGAGESFCRLAWDAWVTVASVLLLTCNDE